MVDLHETNNPERRPQIDNVGWLFFGLRCRYHSRRCDGCLRGKRRDGCGCPCVARSRALGTVLPQFGQLGDVRKVIQFYSMIRTT